VITRVHVNQHVIKANRKSGGRDPVLSAKTHKGNRYGSTVVINGPCKVVYRPDDPLDCGATIDSLRDFGKLYRTHLEGRIGLNWYPPALGRLREMKAESGAVDELLERLRDAASDSYYVTYRRACLLKYIKAVGPRAFYAGYVPHPVPPWHCEELN
jgi:hypothetical protein